MAITEEEVLEAERAAREAADRADEAARAADESRDLARQYVEAAERAADEAREAADRADEAERIAAEKRAEADRAAGVYENAREQAERAQRDLDAARENQRATHDLYPGECNAATEAVDKEVEAAEARVDKANAAAAWAEAEARETEADARAAEDAARTARAEANAAEWARETADEQAVTALDAARGDQGDAIRASIEAANAFTHATALRADFEAQAACEPGDERWPSLPDAAGHSNQPEPPPKEPGVHGSSLFDFNLTAFNHTWKLSKAKWEKAALFLEIILGNYHKFNLGLNELFVAGARQETVVGADFKVTGGNEWRQIRGTRYERNCIVKAESVLGNIDEYVYGNTKKQTPAHSQDANPTVYSDKCPEVKIQSRKVVENFKSKVKNAYFEVQEQAESAEKTISNAWEKIGELNREIKKLGAEIDDCVLKISTYEAKVNDFKIKSSSFVKMLASASIKLSAGKISGKVSGQVKALANSLAEFKGEIKLG